MGYDRAKWHSGLTYRQVCSKCNTTIEYTDEKLGFRYWFPDGFVYCPNRKCKTPLRHSEEYAIDAKVEEVPAQELPAYMVDLDDQPPVEAKLEEPAVEELAPVEAPVVEETPVAVEEPVAVPEEVPAPVAAEEAPAAISAGKKAVEAPFCTKCGTPFDAGECFCAMCGAKRAIKYI